MEPMHIREIAAAIGTTTDAQAYINAVSTDSRDIPMGALFIALEGEHFDGHDYVASAFESGAAFAIIHHDCVLSEVPENCVLRVKNTQDALISIGAVYREKFYVHCVGVTGSVGKTTTKDMIATALSAKFHTLKTPGNFNNEIGLPKTLLELDKSYDAAVIEMGMQGLGEIAILANAAKPQIGVITNIGVSHIEQLGTRENILRAKLELADALPEGAPLILCGDNDLLSTVHQPRLFVRTYGIENEKCDWTAHKICEFSTQTVFTAVYNEKVAGKVIQHCTAVTIPCIGKHNVLNALAAIAVGYELGIATEDCAKALENYVPSGMRQKITEWSGHTFFEDCYNASPDSMRAALETLSKRECIGRRIAVLGDMLELGEISECAHKEIGEFAARKNIDILLTYGEAAKNYVIGAAKIDSNIVAESFTDMQTLEKQLRSELNAFPGSVIWVKGSHGMHMEDLLKRLYGRDEA